MTYLSDLHSYLHHSSLLIQAYPTTRITTKYSLPRKQKPSPSTSKPSQSSSEPTTTTPAREKRDPSATLTLKTFHPESGICLKYRTDKAAEVGRLMSGLGRLAKGEVIEMSSAAAATAADGERMDVDETTMAATAVEEKSSSIPTTTSGGAKKKKKGKGGK